MGILIAAAAAAISLGTARGFDDAAALSVQCPADLPIMVVDAPAAPLLVGAFGPAPRPADSAAIAPPTDAWGVGAMRAYDVMSSLGSGGAPALPTAMTPADEPPPLPMSSPLAWVLAGAGLLGLLYVRRTQM